MLGGGGANQGDHNAVKQIILFDMDGVLADFFSGSLLSHGRTLRLKDARWDFMTQVGFASGGDPSFWKPLESRDFWANLEPLADGMALFDRVASAFPRDQVGFLSSGLCPGSADGKRAWIAKHLPGWERHLILGTMKGLMAAPNKILLDDHDGNVDAFRDHGGRAVMIPRPWNRCGEHTNAHGHFDVDAVYGSFKEVLHN